MVNKKIYSRVNPTVVVVRTISGQRDFSTPRMDSTHNRLFETFRTAKSLSCPRAFGAEVPQVMIESGIA